MRHRERVFCRGCSSLPSSSRNRSVAGQGRPIVTDGPFAETKEALGGYYIIDCRDAEEAQYWARRLARRLCGARSRFRALRAIPGRVECEQTCRAVNA